LFYSIIPHITTLSGLTPLYQHVIARSEATKQSILSLLSEMDCFASLAMTVLAWSPATRQTPYPP